MGATTLRVSFMAREPGTFYVVDRAFADALIKDMSNKEAIRFYLHVKENFRLKGATLGELTDVIGCASGTLNNALRALIKDGKVEARGERFFCLDATNSSTKLATKLATNLCELPPEKLVQDGLFEEYEGRGRTLKSLSRAEDEKNQKLELLHTAFQHYPEILTEVEGRRDAWLELPLGTIADAIEEVTGNLHFVTDLKDALDALANVSVPQRAKFSRCGERQGKPVSEQRQEAPKSVPGEKSAAEVLAEQERVRLEDEAAPFEWSEAGKRFAGRVLGGDEGGGGHAPKGRSPPPTCQLRFNFARFGPRRDCYG